MKAVSWYHAQPVLPHDRLDHPPPEVNVISSSADKRKDESQWKVQMLVRKPNLKSSNEEAPIVCSIQEQSSPGSNKEQFYDGCSKNEQSNGTYTKNNGDKKCQAEKSDMWPVKPAMDM